mgnify:CR=1
MPGHIKNIIKEFIDGDPLRLQMKPSRDWKIILILFFCFVAFVFLFGYISLSVSSGSFSIDVPDAMSPELSIDRTKLSNTLKYWRESESRFNVLIKSQPPALIDPSQ